MAVRSARIYGPTELAGNTSHVLFTVPAGETWLVKRVTARTGGTITGKLYMNISGAAAGSIVHEEPLVSQRSLDREVWWVLEPGDYLRAWHDGPAFTISVHGAMLEGVA